MRIETLLREALTEWSEQADTAPEPGELARRALRRRSRQRVVRASLATATVGLLIATGTAVVLRDATSVDRGALVVPGGSGTGRYTNGRVPTGTGVRSDPRSSPPKRMVAAGDLALSAYFRAHDATYAGRKPTLRRIYYLLDPVAGTYKRTDWAYLDVAPGLATAAVLEGPLPTSRVGLLSTTTGKVTRWLQLDHPAAGVAWSPDGRRLLATTYSQDPDAGRRLGAGGELPQSDLRTGYELIDVATMKAVFQPLVSDPDNPNGRQDVGWSRDGSLIWAPTARMPSKTFYDLSGRPHAAPAHEADVGQDAGLSPDGRHYADDAKGFGAGPATAVYDSATGARTGVQQMEQLVAWADDENLIGLACDPLNCSGKGEFHNRFVLVGIDGKRIVPLTGVRKNSQASGSWEPIFTHR